MTLARTRTSEQTRTDLQVTSGVFKAVGAVSVVAGLWAAACLVGAMAASGGPLALVRAWFTAVTGV